MAMTTKFAMLSLLEVGELAKRALSLRKDFLDPECSEDLDEEFVLGAESDAAAGLRYLVATGILDELDECWEFYTPESVCHLVSEKLKVLADKL